MSTELERLREENAQLRAENARLSSASARSPPSSSSSSLPSPPASFTSGDGLSREQVERYSRQALLPECGPNGTKAFLDSRVVVIGCGGLGSTAILYLAAAGVGHLVLVDGDVVDRSNLHRQIIHTDARVGIPKVDSAKISAAALNPTIRIDTVHGHFSSQNAAEILRGATVVVDCTDNVSARYLVNDACVRAVVPLVSGAAMRWDGQLSVYNLPLDDAADRGPTYRCHNPKPPPAETLGGCSDTGVFGPVPGAIGCLQALEALKVILYLNSRQQPQSAYAATSPASSAPTASAIFSGRMLVWDAFNGSLRTVKMRQRTPAGEEASEFGSLLELGGAYAGGGGGGGGGACNAPVPVDPAYPVDLVTPTSVRRRLRDHNNRTNDFDHVVELERWVSDNMDKIRKYTIVVDVRSATQQRLCNLRDLYDVPHFDCESGELVTYQRFPLSELKKLPAVSDAAPDVARCHAAWDGAIAKLLGVDTIDDERKAAAVGALLHSNPAGRLGAERMELLFVCRRGIDSMHAATLIRKALAQRGGFYARVQVGNVVGGLNRWNAQADERFPLY